MFELWTFYFSKGENVNNSEEKKKELHRHDTFAQYVGILKSDCHHRID